MVEPPEIQVLSVIPNKGKKPSEVPTRFEFKSQSSTMASDSSPTQLGYLYAGGCQETLHVSSQCHNESLSHESKEFLRREKNW